MSVSTSYAADSPGSWSSADDQTGDRTLTTEYADASDRKLAALAARGREGAYRELLHRYERPVFSLVYRMVRDRSLAEDLAQEAFIRAFDKIDSYNPSYKFSNWIFKIANNHAIDYLRRRKVDTVSIHGPRNAASAEEGRSELSVASSGESPEAYVENMELRGQIEDAIARLRPEYRTAVLLRHVEGHTYEEIADVMELPLGTVKTYLHRARHELREHLESRI
jgi:RNA polymerase sigma-70 factor (ECF subfamily)